jgi:stage II sporulation protein D
VTRIDVVERDAAGRVVRLALEGSRRVTLRGTGFRAALSEVLGALALRSTLFTVSRSGERFVFEGRGFGHGVGLCQAGALARARAGETPHDILAFYYPGTVIKRGSDPVSAPFTTK